MNTIVLTGRLTADIELKQTSTGIPVCSFTIAVKRPHTKDTTDFINCVAWRNTAEFVSRYFKKGQMIAVTGCLTARNYADHAGSKRTIYEVVCDNCEFCGGKESAGKEEEKQENVPHFQENVPHFEEVSLDADLPF